jgi:2'-5' RNA ligase
MYADPSPQDRVNSFALVSYIPEPLAGFLDKLRQELVPNCFLRAHITILPPRPCTSVAELAGNQLWTIASEFHPFDISLSEVQVFPCSDVIHIGVSRGERRLREMHKTLNQGSLEFQEPYPYHPHITLAQNLKADEVDELTRVARKRWAEFLRSNRRTFRVDTLTFVQATKYKTWIDLAECKLSGDNVMAPVLRR